MTSKLPPDDPLTRLVLAVFRLNGAFIAAGDRLVRELDLTSARWQVLGAAADAATPQTAAGIARSMGLTRQSVHAIVRELVADGLLELAPNPHHQRAHLVVATERGARAHEAAMAREAVWAAELSRGLDPRRVADAAALLADILDRLSHTDGAADHDD
jgi:DNA-binding MarR family transcriptional regulator